MLAPQPRTHLPSRNFHPSIVLLHFPSSSLGTAISQETSTTVMFSSTLATTLQSMRNHSAAKGKKEGKSNPTSHCHLAIKHFSLIHQLIKQKDLTTVGKNTTKGQNNNKANKSNPPMLSLPQSQEKEGSSFWGIWFDLVFSFNVLKQDVTL